MPRHRPFHTREEPFEHDGFAVRMLLPRAADELIDEGEFDRDERLPYWAELWPSARALTRHLIEGETPVGPVVELGCGVALPSLALAWRGVEVLATDYYEDALEFARANAARNSLAVPRTAPLDWREPPPGLGRFATIVAADVLYERRNGEALAALLPRIALPDARVLIADPGRVHAGGFWERMRDDGWGVREAARRDEASPAGPHLLSVVRIMELRPPP